MYLNTFMFKKLLFLKIFVAILLCYGIIYLFSSFYRSTTTTIIDQVPHHQEKLVLDVYMETRCPDTEIFISGQLQPAVKSLGNYFKLNMYPYGKAQEKFDGEKWKFSCQHGPSECDGNTILGCVISKMNQSTAVYFTSCLMRNLDPVSDYQQCCEKYNLDAAEVTKCFHGKRGNDIQHENAVATSSLDPQLKFIPWIIVNKKYSNANQDKALSDLKGLLCENLKIRPPQCR